MFNFPDTFKRENIDYITLNPLRQFAKNNNIDSVRSSTRRRDIIDAITEYANESSENEKAVNDWIDLSIRSGKKDIAIKKISLDKQQKHNFLSREYLEKKLNLFLPEEGKRHFSCNAYDETYKLIRYDIDHLEYGDRVSLYLCKTIIAEDDSRQIYPAICDIFVDSNILITKIKPRTHIYEDKGNQGKGQKISTVRESERVIEFIADALEIVIKADETLTYMDFKEKLYRMMEDCTQTPTEIINQIESSDEKIRFIAMQIKDEICKVDETYFDDIFTDIKNLVEKYICITVPDKSIFTNGKDVYPIEMAATDEEDSYLKQAAALEQALQSKAIFYDNKKMLQKNKRCDGITFAFRRKGGRDIFSMRFLITQKGCAIKLYEYAEEDEINAAVFTFLNS